MWTRASRPTSASAASSAAWRAVEWPVCGRALDLLLGEARVVDEQLRLVRGDPGHLAGRGVAADDELAPRARLAHHLARVDRAGAALDALAALEALELGARRNPEPLGRLGVEPAGALVLDQRVAVRAHPVLDLERPHLVAVVTHGLRGPELDQLDLVADPPEDPPQGFEELDQPGRADDPQRPVAVVEVVGLQQSRDAEVVVGVQVRDVDLVDLDEPGRALHLALGTLTAVEQQPLAADPRQHAGGRPPRRRHRAAGAEEDHVHVHARRVDAGAGAGGRSPPRTESRLAPE